VENLGEHYIYTIAHWLHRYEERSEEVKREVGETAYRIWRLYLALVLQEFQAGAIHLYQTLLVKCDTGKSGLPLMREDWYSEPLRTTV
jgi:cyclopropane-fatty-acyl-phospholipid synthase